MGTPWSRYLELARASKASYAGPINHRRYSYGGTNFETQKIIHGSFGRGYCRLFWNEKNLVIAFRGTRERIDWAISNIQLIPVSLRDCTKSETVKVHYGFQRTLDYGDKTTELKSLDAIHEHIESFELLEKNISITGHSLGGAFAVLYATKFRAKWPDYCSSNLVEVVTFGAPAVGLRSFKEFYGDLNNKTVRIVNGFDGVPFTPPAFYRHVGKEIWLGHDGTSDAVGWRTRLRLALRTPFRLSADHAMSEYIARLTEKVQLQTEDQD